MKEEALRSVSLDHSLSFSVRVISYATASAVWTDTPERECSDQMRRCVGKEGFWEKKECKSSFWREVTGHFRTDRTYIYYPQVCLCMLCSRANKWEVSLKMECVNENTRLGSVCAPAADELLCEVYAREHMHSNTRTHTQTWIFRVLYDHRVCCCLLLNSGPKLSTVYERRERSDR